MPIVWPRPLRPGATIAVIAPSSPVPAEALARGVAALRARGYEVRLGEHVGDRHYYLAGDDEARLADWHWAWSDPSVDAVWCARGGSGAQRLLRDLDYDQIAARRLPFVGYSDITALQAAIGRRTGLVTFSGAMVGSGFGYGGTEGIDPETEALLWQWLDPRAAELPLANPGGEPLTVVSGGAAEGRLVGGCLTLVAGVVGTPYGPDFEGGILVLEDVGDDPHRLDRYLAHLHLAGVFDQVAAVVFGDFEDCYPPHRQADGPPVEAMIERFVAKRDIPLLTGLRYGHIRHRCAVPLGAWARLEAGAVGATIVVEGPGAGGRE